MKLTLCVLVAAACSKGSNTDPPSKSQKHEFVVELDPGAQVKPGTNDGIRTVEDFGAADKTYAVFEADNADALSKYLASAGMTPKKDIEVREIN